ncbi:MAG: GNAT family N-acetyltransferase [Clostridia bacterium]|nr:GNAT family N-acetyltransferase [Clostridia bacterium]
MEIRRATVEDIAQINRLLYQVAGVHHKGRPDIFRPNAKKYTDVQLQKIIADNSRPIFVGVLGNKILAHLFGVLKMVQGQSCLADRKTLYIDDLCVDETVRGQRIGQQMYAFIKDYAKKEGCYNITLNVWTCNPGAMRFYEKMGLLPQKVYMEEIL